MKLKTFRIMAIVTGLVGTTLLNRFLEGGALFMSLILMCLLLSIYFIARGFFTISSNPEVSRKMLKHVNDCGVLGMTLGFIGAFIGLIGAFDAIEAFGGPVAPAILAGGLKIALLSPLFGLFTYAISRLGILILRVIQK